MSESTPKKNPMPGQGIGSMKFTTGFRMSNFELFTKPNKLVMALGLTCFGLSLLYIANMAIRPENTIHEEYEGTFGSDQLIGKLLKDTKSKSAGGNVE